MEILNLTPHDIIVQKKDGSLKRILKSDSVARLSTREVHVGEVVGTPIFRREFGETKGLPDELEGVMYLVSSFVLQANQHRMDILAPDTGPTAIRDDRGQIVAVTRFIKN